MRLWILDADARPIASPLDRAPVDGALAEIVGCVGRDDFGSAALAGLNSLLPVDSWSIYRIHAEQPPLLHASGSYRVPDTTASCFRAYRDGLYRADESFDAARVSASGASAVMTHWQAEEMAAPHRERIYREHGMRERVSLIRPDGAGGLMAVNLYRHQHQHAFEPDDFHRVHAAARLLLACVDRHVALAGPLPARVGRSVPATLPGGSVESLQRLCPALTSRELQICERLLRGWTYDGIATDLGLSVPTVKTYRNRAFGRLGIHYRNELFGLVLGAGAAS